MGRLFRRLWMRGGRVLAVSKPPVVAVVVRRVLRVLRLRRILVLLRRTPGLLGFLLLWRLLLLGCEDCMCSSGFRWRGGEDVYQDYLE